MVQDGVTKFIGTFRPADAENSITRETLEKIIETTVDHAYQQAATGDVIQNVLTRVDTCRHQM